MLKRFCKRCGRLRKVRLLRVRDRLDGSVAYYMCMTCGLVFGTFLTKKPL